MYGLSFSTGRYCEKKVYMQSICSALNEFWRFFFSCNQAVCYSRHWLNRSNGTKGGPVARCGERGTASMR